MTACDRSGLVEASFDNRLGPTEELSLRRHLDGCVACRTLLADLEETRAALRIDEPTALEHQRARLVLLRKAASPTVARPSKRRTAALVLGFSFVLVSFAVFAATASRSPRPPAALDTPTTLEVPSNMVAPRVSPAQTIDPPIASAEVPAAEVPVSKKVTTRAATPPSNASQEFAHAMAALERGDFGAAAIELAAFAKAHPNDPRAEEAVYLEAIALERAGRTSDARASARRYLSRYPDGAHRVPAQRLAGE